MWFFSFYTLVTSCFACHLYISCKSCTCLSLCKLGHLLSSCLGHWFCMLFKLGSCISKRVRLVGEKESILITISSLPDARLRDNIDLPDEKPASGAAAAIKLKRHYKEDSSSEEEPTRETKQKVVKIDLANNIEDDDPPLVSFQGKILEQNKQNQHYLKFCYFVVTRKLLSGGHREFEMSSNRGNFLEF